MLACSRMISPARLRLSKRRGSATSRSSSAKRSRLRSMRRLKSIRVAALYERRKDAAVTDRRYRRQLSFLLSPRGFGAAVTAGEFFHAPGGIDEFLFAGEKWMASGTNTDLNIATRRAGVIHRAARTSDVGLVVLWMKGCCHVRKRARNVTARTMLCTP